ncbi:hypothetical protein [Colwellia sp. TT2012]|uniref:hypothetical protein n=1 Tax=Colwellia sp. TT2012 TaxID=1720342 RepID=UPI00070B082E|nr:hypothetical protein [Colwellia sp. TT2012]
MPDCSSAPLTSDVALRNAIFSELKTDVQINRLRNKLISILGTQVAETYKATENERSLLMLIFIASNQFKNWIQYIEKKDTLNPHSLGNYEPYKGILKEEEIRVVTVLNFWKKTTSFIQGDTSSLFVLEDNCISLELCAYGISLMEIESFLIDCVNKHQQKYNDFSNQTTIMNAGITTAIKYAETYIDKVFTTDNFDPYTVDSVFETVLKTSLLNRAKAQCGGKIETAKQNSKLDWLNWPEINGLIDLCDESKTSRRFEVLEKKYDLSSSDKKHIQHLLKNILISRFSMQGEQLERNLNCKYQLSIIGYLVLSDRKRQEKLKVNHYGENNPNKPLQIDNNHITYTEDIFNFYGDRYAAIDSLTDLQRTDVNTATDALKAYFETRIQKNDLLIKLHDKLEIFSCNVFK